MESILDNIDIYLPQYLSAESYTEIKDELKKFAACGTADMYTYQLTGYNMIFQGDGISDLPYYDATTEACHHANVLVLSNTCDISQDNTRLNHINICIAPILNLQKYEKMLITKGYKESQIIAHINDIKNQSITHIFYLPRNRNMDYDAIVCLDKICSLDRRKFPDNQVVEKRLFTLSDVGFYLFLLKLSIHFTRIREKIDRRKGVIL